MTATVGTLTVDERDALRERFSPSNDLRWVERIAAERGWEQANRSYLESMRQQGFEEMSALMKEAGAQSPLSPEEALQLVELALEVYQPAAKALRTVDEAGDAVLSIEVRECPVFARIEQAGWHGVTACGSCHRRQGWYQALGVQALDSVVGEKKWGDPACATLVKILAALSEHG